MCLCLCMLSCVQLFVTSWTTACQAPLSKGFSRQEYWSELPFIFAVIFRTQELKLCLLWVLHWQADFYH